MFWHIGIVTELGDTGKDTLYGMISETLRDYGEFDGFTCKEEDSDMTQYNTDKNRERVKEIRKKVEQHNLDLVSQYKKEYK